MAAQSTPTIARNASRFNVVSCRVDGRRRGPKKPVAAFPVSAEFRPFRTHDRAPIIRCGSEGPGNICRAKSAASQANFAYTLISSGIAVAATLNGNRPEHRKNVGFGLKTATSPFYH
jgi:hypothetical protein